MNSMMPILDIAHVSRSFVKDKRALDDVSLAIHAHEVVALLGRNGAGKTTLVQIAMGMLFPDTGSARIFGLDPMREPVAVKRRIGFVAETQVLPPVMRIPELLAFHRYLFPTWDNALEKQLLERFGLAGSNAKIGTLSKGQARQLALICAVAHRPELLILDEPAGGLDPAARREFLETSIQLLNSGGTTILFSTHHMNDVERLGGRVVLLDEGRVRLDRELDALRDDHCVAVIPRHSNDNVATLERLPNCLRARLVHDEWHAVFRGTPDDVRAQLQALAGLGYVQCASVPLEELFIELVGGRPMAEAQ